MREIEITGNDRDGVESGGVASGSRQSHPLDKGHFGAAVLHGCSEVMRHGNNFRAHNSMRAVGDDHFPPVNVLADETRDRL